MATRPEDFEALVKPVWWFAYYTPDRIPLSDWHETTNGKSVGFRARSVGGRVFHQAAGRPAAGGKVTPEHTRRRGSDAMIALGQRSLMSANRSAMRC